MKIQCAQQQMRFPRRFSILIKIVRVSAHALKAEASNRRTLNSLGSKTV